MDRARSSRYTVVDAVSVIGTHSDPELVKASRAHELFTRQDAKVFCDRVAQENPKVVEDLVPKICFPLSTIQRVIQNMLRSRTLPIRDLRRNVSGTGRGCAQQQEPGPAPRIPAPGHAARDRKAGRRRAQESCRRIWWIRPQIERD